MKTGRWAEWQSGGHMKFQRYTKIANHHDASMIDRAMFEGLADHP